MRLRAVISGFLMITSSLSAEVQHITSLHNATQITYVLIHPLHTVESTSRDASIALDIDGVNQSIAKVVAQVDVTTFDSGNSNRDSHAMEVVDALSYPDSKFESASVWQKEDSVWASGKLTFHGVERDVVIAGVVRWMKSSIGYDGTFSIRLSDFKVERPALLMVPVRDELKFLIHAVFNR